MRIETERKFLVNDLSFKERAIEQHHLSQGYIAHDRGNTVRVRIADDGGILTVKGPTSGLSRPEWEKEISLQDAEELLKLCRNGIVDKTRYIIPAAGGRRFEVDEFHGDNEGLIVAEIELGSENEPFERPAWLGPEVTGDPRYYNSSLSRRPFKEW